MAAKKKTQKKNYTVKKDTGKKYTSKKQEPKERVFAIALLMAFLTLIFSAFCYLPTDATGVLGEIIHDYVFLGLFSSTMIFIPIITLGLTIYIFRVKDSKRFFIKLSLCSAVLILCGALSHLFSKADVMYFELYDSGINGIGGGLLGGALGILFNSLIGRVASIIVIIFAIIVLLCLIFKISVVSLVASLFEGLKEEFDDIEDVDISEQVKKIKKPKKRDKASGHEIKDKPETASDLDFEIDTKVKKPESDSVVSEEELQKRIEKLIYENTDAPKEAPEKEEKEEKAEKKKTENVQESLEDTPKEPAKSEQPERVDPVSAEEKAKISKEIDSAIETEIKEYVFPPINLLSRPKAASADKRREMSETAKKLMDILKNFGVEAKLQQVTQGPTVTRYEIQPSTGIKLAKITGLAEDIALNLAVPTVLVAPVPGKAAVGIEVPNTSVNTVSARELIESDEYKNGKSKLTVAFGKDIGGNVVVGDIAKMPHVLIAGSTGSGKSVCINTIIVSLLYRAKPDEVKLIMIDPKVVELSVYNGIPHLLIPVVTDPKRAAGALNWAVGEMMRRYSLFAQTATRNLEGYNALMQKTGGEKIPQIVIIIDELADLMMVAAKEVEEYICRLAQLARAAGIHLIIATQRPSVDVITGLIKANVPSRIAFAVSSQVDSRTILDKGGAEKLLGRGDMLYHPAGLSNAKRVQGAFVSDDEIAKVTDFVKSNNEESHYSEDLAEHIDNCEHGGYGVTDEEDGDDADALLPEAIELALELGQISTAMVQRRLKVGYARAGRIIDQMEMRGLIGGANGSKPREVYKNRILSLGDFEELPNDED